MSNEDGSGPAFPVDARRDKYTGQILQPASDGLSQRAYAAIHLRVPDSGLPWLDAMIERARGESAWANQKALDATSMKNAPSFHDGQANISGSMLAQGRKG